MSLVSTIISLLPLSSETGPPLQRANHCIPSHVGGEVGRTTCQGMMQQTGSRVHFLVFVSHSHLKCAELLMYSSKCSDALQSLKMCLEYLDPPQGTTVSCARVCVCVCLCVYLALSVYDCHMKIRPLHTSSKNNEKTRKSKQKRSEPRPKRRQKWSLNQTAVQCAITCWDPRLLLCPLRPQVFRHRPPTLLVPRYPARRTTNAFYVTGRRGGGGVLSNKFVATNAKKKTSKIKGTAALTSELQQNKWDFRALYKAP